MRDVQGSKSGSSAWIGEVCLVPRTLRGFATSMSADRDR